MRKCEESDSEGEMREVRERVETMRGNEEASIGIYFTKRKLLERLS
jgi:hypothetical protein